MRWKLTLLLIFAGALSLTPTASAREIEVDKTVDQAHGSVADGCSLRNAFIAATTDTAVAGCRAGSDSDVIRMPAGTYTLSLGSAGDSDPASGDLDMAGPGSLRIEPTGTDQAVTINGEGADRLFDRSEKGTGKLVIHNLTLSGGNADGGGGAIRNASPGTVEINGVTLSGNRAAGNGGAVLDGGLGAFLATNSTFAENVANGDGGAVAVAARWGYAHMRNVTVAFNAADADGNGSGRGGGIAGGSDTSAITMMNSVLADNTDGPPSQPGPAPDCYAQRNFRPTHVVSTQQLGSLVCAISVMEPSIPTTFSPLDPRLGELGSYGGPTETIPIGIPGPAAAMAQIGDPDKCPAKDQRGAKRPPFLCDLGAFQASRPGHGNLAPLPAPSATTAIFNGRSVTLRVICPSGVPVHCHSRSALTTEATYFGVAMSKRFSMYMKSGSSMTVQLRVKPRFRARVEAMTHVTQRRLSLRQWIRGDRIPGGSRPRTVGVFKTYSVRMKDRGA